MSDGLEAEVGKSDDVTGDRDEKEYISADKREKLRFEQGETKKIASKFV